MEVLKHFATENYTGRLDIVQNSDCVIFRHFYPEINIRKNLKQIGL